jgi:hypothetical protein
MPYLGNPPAEAYTTTVKDSFSGDGSTTAFTLSVPSTTNNLRVVVENVVQDPTVAYSVSGTTLTFTSAPPTGTNNVYAVNLGPAVQTVVPPDGVTVTDLNAYADGAAAFTANRASSDGTIIDLQKDGTTVGSIGASGGETYIGNADTGIKFNSGNDYIQPFNVTGGSGRDNAIDIGNSGNRFKDLYLSGGVYLGGTGSSNLLQDYETGTFTPSLKINNSETGITYVSRAGSYTKIGRCVFLLIEISLSSKGSTVGPVKIDGVPFTIGDNLSTTSYNGSGYAYFDNLNSTTAFVYAWADDGTTDLLLRRSSGSDSFMSNFANSDLTNTSSFRITVQYET